MPALRPSFLADFANSRQLDPRITFTRASAAWSYNKLGLLVPVAANEPRFDHDPVTLACRGLLIEESRTNLLTRSEEFDNAAWTKGDATIAANSEVSPDGATTADTVIEAATTATHFVLASVSVVSGTTYTLSVFAKQAGRQFIQLTFGNAGGTFAGLGAANFNLSTGVASSAGGSLVSFGIEALPRGVYRCWISATATATGATNPYICLANSSAMTRLGTYAGDGVSGAYIWGAQLEAGAFPTSYIPTAGSQVTRALGSGAVSGAAFAAIYRSADTTLAGNSIGLTSAYTIATIDDGTANNRISVQRLNSTTIRATITSGGVTQATLDATTSAFVTGVGVQWSLAFSAGSADLSVNGGTPVTGTPAAIPTVTQLTLGANQWMRRLSMYPARVANADVQALATQ